MRTEIRKEVDRTSRKENFIRGEYCINPIAGAAFMWIGVGEDSMAFQKIACRALVAQRWSEDVNPNSPRLPVNYYDILDYKHGPAVMVCSDITRGQFTQRPLFAAAQASTVVPSRATK